MKTIHFKKTNTGFSKELQRRVKSFFKENNISRNANNLMVFKTIVMFGLYFGAYALLMTLKLSHWERSGLLLLLGLGALGIATGVMHDANHGSYSKKRWINNFLGHGMTILGLSKDNWCDQHNALHHTNTNINEHDPDIAVPSLLRFSEYQKRYVWHKFQYVYAPILYTLQVIAWFVFGDFTKWNDFRKRGLHKTNINSVLILVKICLTKIFYISYMIVLPTIVLEIPFWQPIIAVLMVQGIIGEGLTHIFVFAHVVDNVDMHDDTALVEDEFMVHQLKTTSNFAMNSKILDFFIGGLGFQIEHHLFPNICHVHYKKISSIVKKTAQEYGLPYNVNKTLWDACKAHYSKLKWLGTPESVF